MARGRALCCPSAVTAVATQLERLGGPEALRIIIDDFIDRVTSDLMIGFHFRGVDKERLKQMEFEFARAHLGGSEAYGGRPLRAAHSPHKVLGGQFNRRLVILRQVLEKHGAPEDVIEHWIAHNEKLRSHITQDSASECND